MSESDTRARWVIPLLAALAALVLLTLWLGRRSHRIEPRGDARARLSHLDAGAARPRGDGGSRTPEELASGDRVRPGGANAPQQSQLHAGRMDGAVRLYLPEPEPLPDQVVFSPDELRVRRSEQISLIEDRIEALEQRIGNAPESSLRPLLERRRDHLIERRDVLISTLLDPNE